MNQEEKNEQLRLTKKRLKIQKLHTGKNIINFFQKINQKNAEEEEEIELILEEANAYNLRKEVKAYAEDILQKDDILISRIDAYLMAYHELIND